MFFQRHSDKLLGGYDDSALSIDETGIPKKGKMSVGVVRQGCGQHGKVDNCQGAVFAAFGRGHFSTPIDCRLFMPGAWIKDRDRCKKAKIPEDRIVFKTKHEQALERIFSARKNGVRFKWVGSDRFYGDNRAFLRKLADNGEEFMADIHRDHRIYYEDPQPVVPLPKSNKGKKPSKLQAQARSIRVDRWVAKQSPKAWKRVKLGESSKGKLLVDILHRQIWVWDGKESCARKWHLVGRREINSPEKIR